MFTIKFKKLIFWIILSNKFYNFENETKVSLKILTKNIFLFYYCSFGKIETFMEIQIPHVN